MSPFMGHILSAHWELAYLKSHGVLSNSYFHISSCNTSTIVKVQRSVVITIRVSKRKLQKWWDFYAVPKSRPANPVQSASRLLLLRSTIVVLWTGVLPYSFDSPHSIAFAQLSPFLSSISLLFVQWSRCKHNKDWFSKGLAAHFRPRLACLQKDRIPTASQHRTLFSLGQGHSGHFQLI